MLEQSIFEKTFLLYKEVFIINNKIDKLYRYSIGVNLENSILKFSELIMTAKYASKNTKAQYLLRANAELEIVRMKLRLILELKIIPNPSTLFKLAADIDTIGAMLGGWLRANKS